MNRISLTNIDFKVPRLDIEIPEIPLNDLKMKSKINDSLKDPHFWLCCQEKIASCLWKLVSKNGVELQKSEMTQ